jgi:protein-tyrosine sulfotransferase
MSIIRKAQKAGRSAWRAVQSRYWRRPPYTSSASPIIVGGCGRSGTTLMRVILDTHPRICCGPESRLFQPRVPSPPKLARRFGLPEAAVGELFVKAGSQAEFIDRFFALYCQSRTKPRWAEKTPRNVLYLDYIFEHFPDARFVHMIRDGRDTICSLRTHPRHKVVDGKIVKLNTWHPIEPCLERWLNDVRAGLAFRGDPRYTEIRYEALVAHPRETLAPLFDFLGEPFDQCVLEYHREQGQSRDATLFPQNPEATKPMFAKSVARWHRDLSADELALVKREAGPLLKELKYTPDDQW